MLAWYQAPCSAKIVVRSGDDELSVQALTAGEFTTILAVNTAVEVCYFPNMRASTLALLKRLIGFATKST